jgi:hypothetical protein
MKTIVDLVHAVHGAAIGTGLDASPKDIAFIISLFLTGLSDHSEYANKAVDAWLLAIADEVNSTKDE